MVKVNMDASYHRDVGKGGVGSIIRDPSGKFLDASTSFMKYASSVVAMEALALH